MPKKQTKTTNAKKGEDKTTPRKGIKSLGILFVHGIGTQRRGDTLVQCGTTIYNWLREWIKKSAIEGENISIDLLDTSLIQSQGNEPAHSRLIFRKEKTTADISWLLAESCWAETFRPASYGEFVRWTFRVLPIAAVLHLVTSYRRNFRVMKTALQALNKGYLAYHESIQLQRDIGPWYGTLPSEPFALGKFLILKAGRATSRLLLYPFLLSPLLFFAIFVQAILFMIMIIGIIPIGFLRSLTSWVQKKVAAVLGDSYIFVTNPISKSAAVTQVKQDFLWLSRRCDRIAILAHSQGAAIAYRAIEEWSWEGGAPFSKLKRLITYGSGLRKLFDLEQLSGEQSFRNAFFIKMAGVLIALGSIGSMIFVPWLIGAVTLLPFALSFTFGFVFQLFALLILTQNVKWADPPLPAGILWKDFFASHDPISNGPITVSTPKSSPSGNSPLDNAFNDAAKMLTNIFYLSQHVVINLQSTIADHTTYWSAKDDFVSRVGIELLEVSEIGLPGAADTEWLDVSAQRRLWRVRMRARCRIIAILSTLFIAFWPFKFINEFGKNVSESFLRVKAFLTAQWLPNWFRSFEIPASLYNLSGRIALIFCIGLMFAIALAGWRMWERREFAHFYRRKPFKSAGLGIIVFAFGWIGILIVTPLATALLLGWQALGSLIWSSSLLLLISCWMIIRSGKGPGRFSSWIPTLLERGEQLLAQKTQTQSENIAHAKGYFYWAIRWLSHNKDSYKKDSKEWIRALLGMASAQEQMKELAEMTKDEIKALRDLYKKAIFLLEKRGEDTGAVRQNLDRLPGDEEKTEAEQKNGETPF